MYFIKKTILTFLAVSLFFPITFAEDSVYRIEGLPSNLYYTADTSYEIILSASNYSEISEVNISVTNGSLSESENFVDGTKQLLLPESLDGWKFYWKAPSENYDLGEGESQISINFIEEGGDVWASYENVLRPPPKEADKEANVPNWASSLAWTGASIVVILTVIGSLILRRDRLT